MAVKTIARPGQESTTETQPAYVLRGHGLFEMFRDELEYVGGGCWLIPSGSKEGLGYEVRVSTTRPGRERCECTGFMHHGHCSHLVCAGIAHRRSAVCDACGERKYWQELTEVQEGGGRAPRLVSRRRALPLLRSSSLGLA